MLLGLVDASDVDYEEGELFDYMVVVMSIKDSNFVECKEVELELMGASDVGYEEQEREKEWPHHKMSRVLLIRELYK